MNDRFHALPEVDSHLLVTHLEYARWSRARTLALVDRLPKGAMSTQVESSFPTIVDTLKQVYGWDLYYFIHMRGERIRREDIALPLGFRELCDEWPRLHDEMVDWGRKHLPHCKDNIVERWRSWPTWMIVMQVASHATHHFGQVVTLARQLGCDPERADFTDLILFYLERFSVPDVAT